MCSANQQAAVSSVRAYPLLALCALVLGATLLPAAPAEASEVVKLARLVITGKRSTAAAEPVAATPQRVEQLPRVLVEGRRSDDGVSYAAAPRRSLPKAL